MIFTKRLRDGVRRGEITCSIRTWMRPHVTVGQRYRMEEGEIEVDSILPIRLADITPELARASGFKGVIDLLKVAKHGRGENIYLVRFHFVPAASRHPRRARPIVLQRLAGHADGEAMRGNTVLPDTLIDAWRTNNRVTTYLVEHMPPPLWSMPVPGAPRRTVRMVAAHLHNSRCGWIRALGGRDGIVPPPLVDLRRVTPTALLRALSRSSEGMIRLIELGATRGGSVPRAIWQNFPTDLEHFLAYFVAHEAHHRGQLVLIARQLGQPLPKAVTIGLWQWIKLGRGMRRP